MPAVSKAQYRYIQALKAKHVTRAAAPDEDKWVFDAEWTDGEFGVRQV
jgi:hypothetical protein